MPLATVTTATHSASRVVLWIVLALLALAVAYACAMVVVNWSAIHV